MKPKQNNLKAYDIIKKINPNDPQPDLIQKAADFISRGKVISFPTRCLYGLGADALNTNAVDKIFQIKKRPLNKPILVLVKNREQMDRLVSLVTASAERIMEKFWPGKVTLIFNARPDLPTILTAGTGKIGIRMPGHKVAMALCNAIKNPITGTSANLSGESGYSKISDFHLEILTRLSLVLDAGPLAGGTGSTVVDVTTDPPRVLREGTVRAKAIYEAL